MFVTSAFNQTTTQANGRLNLLRSFETNTDPRRALQAIKCEMIAADAVLQTITGTDMGGMRESDTAHVVYPVPKSMVEATQMFMAVRESVLSTMDALTNTPPARLSARQALALGVQGLMDNAVFLVNELSEFMDNAPVSATLGVAAQPTLKVM